LAGAQFALRFDDKIYAEMFFAADSSARISLVLAKLKPSIEGEFVVAAPRRNSAIRENFEHKYYARTAMRS
jgi:hypothetical protein